MENDDLYNKINYKIGQTIYLKPYSKINPYLKSDPETKQFYNKCATITGVKDDNKGYLLNIDDEEFLWFEVEFENTKIIRKKKLEKIYKNF